MIENPLKNMDRYDRATKLYPALLCSFPAFWFSGVDFFAELHSKETASVKFASTIGVWGIALFAGALFAVRNLGNKVQERLYEKWGGIPSVTVLRHRDPTFGVVVKRAAHAFLSSKIHVKAPSEKKEASDPKSADGFYEAGSLWLKENTRDKKRFPLLFNDLIYYGFFRNCLGLKPYALGILLFIFGISIFREGILNFSGFHIEVLANVHQAFWFSVVIQMAAFGSWIFLITEKAVKGSALTYARTLVTSYVKA